ncbi:ABC transporter [Mycena latifolia]|nr:ABC transporter [Mycena latifolia]
MWDTLRDVRISTDNMGLESQQLLPSSQQPKLGLEWNRQRRARPFSAMQPNSTWMLSLWRGNYGSKARERRHPIWLNDLRHKAKFQSPSPMPTRDIGISSSPEIFPAMPLLPQDLELGDMDAIRDSPANGNKTFVEPKASSEDAQLAQDTLVSGRQLVLISIALYVAFFLVALDQTILSTALPTIASHFQAVSDLSWIASAYFLPEAGLVLFFGKLLVIAPPKTVFLVSIFAFEIGSLLCALSPSVNVLIVGRAVAGLGGTGLWVSIMTIIARITTMKQRPIFMGMIGAVYALASVVGPLMGGAFSAGVSVRPHILFLDHDKTNSTLGPDVNLPIGAIAIVTVIFALPRLSTVQKSQSTLKKWLYLDWIGAFLSFAMVVMLLIAVQWGGNEKPWSDPTVIALLALFAAALIAFLAWETWYGPEAILPVHILMRRNICGAAITMASGLQSYHRAQFFVSVCFVTVNPLLYQVRGHSATRSGIDILPFMTTGYAWPFLVTCPLIAAAAFGLLFTVTATTSSATIIGFQVLLGVGLGSCIQLPIVVAQGEFADHDQHLVPQSTSLVTFLQLLGSSAGLAITGAVFQGQLRSHLRAQDLSPALLEEVLSSVKAIFAIPSPERSQVVEAYVAAVERVFLIGISCGIIASLGSLMIERRKVKMEAVSLSL